MKRTITYKVELDLPEDFVKDWYERNKQFYTRIYHGDEEKVKQKLDSLKIEDVYAGEINCAITRISSCIAKSEYIIED